MKDGNGGKKGEPPNQRRRTARLRGDDARMEIRFREMERDERKMASDKKKKRTYQPKKTAKGLDEVEDYGRGIRYTKFGERNTTYGKTGTYQTVYGKDGSQTTRKIGKRTAADVRGSEGPKKRIKVKRRRAR